MRYLFALFFCILSGCTYSVVVNGSAGGGNDGVEETDTIDPTISPTISVPREAL